MPHFHNSSSEKTVYVLGAGFSAPAGGPPQDQLLRHIFSLDDAKPRVSEYKSAVMSFLVDTLYVSPEHAQTVSLEDIYTPMDRCLADGLCLRNKSTAQLREVRAKLEYLISLAIDNAIDSTSANSGYVHSFAKFLVRQAAIRAEKAQNEPNADAAKKWDPFAIISLNWDVLLDNALYEALERQDQGMTGDYDPIGVVDYCCYVSSIESWQKRIRAGLWTLGSRGYNVKLLKIHGSMNWLQCSQCQRLFVGFGEKINIPAHINEKTCRHCFTHGHKTKLQGSLVMPTFLKDLSNFQIKLVWQNAAVEVMEARHIVFIGYSLPHSDFEFRQMLTRMVHKDASIHVVLFCSDADEGNSRYEQECARYRQFFGGRKLTFEPEGVIKFVQSLPSE